MTNHPRFEEIANLVFTKAVDANYFQLAARVNAHLCACESCKHVYHILLTAREHAEEAYFSRTYSDVDLDDR